MILKEGDVVYILSEHRKALVTFPEVFLKRGLEFVLLYNINDKYDKHRLN